MPQLSADDWYYRMLGEEFGPVSRNVLDSLIADGQIGSSDEVRAGAAGAWIPARQLESNGNGSHGGGGAMSLESLSDAGLGTSGVMQDQWFYQSLGQDWGPISFEELLSRARQGDLTPDDQIRMGFNGKWRRAGSMGRLMAEMPYAVRESKTIPTGKKTDVDFDTTIALKESSYAEVVPPPPPPVPAPPAPLPPPPPPPPPPPAPIPQMMPQPQIIAMPTYAPPAYTPHQNPAEAMGWFAWLDGVECGPMDFGQIMNWARSGKIGQNDYIKQGKYSTWVLAQRVQGLTFQPPPAPPPAPAPVRQVVAAPAAAAPAALPAVQLPPPPPKPAPAPAPVAPPPPAAVAAPPPPPRPVEPPKPEFPADAPPIRQWTNDWATSTVKSTYRPGMEAATAVGKKPTPAKSKKKSGGGDFDVNELMKDKRVLGGLGVVVLLVAGWFGMGMLPEGTGPLKKAHQELSDAYKKIDEKKGDVGDEKAWKSLGTSMKTKLTNATKPIGTSQHKAKQSLTSAKSALDSALKAKKTEDVEKALKNAEKKLDDAKDKLGL